MPLLLSHKFPFGKIESMSLYKLFCLLLLTALLGACSSAEDTPTPFPTYDPFLPIQQETRTPRIFSTVTRTVSPTSTREPTPTRAPLTISPVASQGVDQTAFTPTPDAERVLPTPRQDSVQYIVQAGDTLGSIALAYDISVETLMEANQITDPNLLDIGTVLVIPAPHPVGNAPAFKVIPDSELVYGPGSVYFDIDAFIDSQNGYLETYEEEVNGILLTGGEIVWIVARNYSVNPRLLLALLEYQSGWVTNPQPFNTDYPMGLLDEFHYGLYRQLTWTADNLNRGYYLWRANAISTVVLNDGTVAPLDPTINAGTAGLQYFFSQLDDRATWEADSGPTGLLLTYYVFFGNPFNYAIEPVVPDDLVQPAMTLPFEEGQTWFFTGGPHGGWDSGSAWAALDFAPPGDNGSCLPSPLWVTAMADGLILRASNGAVMQDLDNDGYEQTGWVIFYMHMATEGRANPGDYLFAGERVGHPSCEGGVSNATHVHLARKYNGEWIAADGSLPFNLDGWVSSGNGIEYDGYLSDGGQTIEAWDGANDINSITH
jgi:LysM repeat protein